MTDKEIDLKYSSLYDLVGLDMDKIKDLFDYLFIISDIAAERGEDELAETIRWASKYKIRPIARIEDDKSKVIWLVNSIKFHRWMKEGVPADPVIPSVININYLSEDQLKPNSNNYYQIDTTLTKRGTTLVQFNSVMDSFRFLIPVWKKFTTK